MPNYFLDSSALVKAYRREQGTQRVVDLLNGHDPLVISQLAQVEVSSAIVRRARATAIADADIVVVLAQLDRDIADLFVIAMTDAIITQGAIRNSAPLRRRRV